LHVREALGLVPGSEVEVTVDGNAARLTKQKTGTRRSLGREIVEHARGRGTGALTTDEIMRLMRAD
jgi:bifunctional DNA-binding transcriptional regulator/antitoxin component of YhaV-PrlF toxin-antitoxin module